MKKKGCMAALAGVMTLSMVVTGYAGWRQDTTGWWYQEEDTSISAGRERLRRRIHRMAECIESYVRLCSKFRVLRFEDGSMFDIIKWRKIDGSGWMETEMKFRSVTA